MRRGHQAEDVSNRRRFASLAANGRWIESRDVVVYRRTLSIICQPHTQLELEPAAVCAVISQPLTIDHRRHRRAGFTRKSVTIDTQDQQTIHTGTDDAEPSRLIRLIRTFQPTRCFELPSLIGHSLLFTQKTGSARFYAVHNCGVHESGGAKRPYQDTRSSAATVFGWVTLLHSCA